MEAMTREELRELLNEALSEKLGSPIRHLEGMMRAVDAYAESLRQSPAPDEKDENGLLPCAHCGGKMHVKGITKHFKESNVYSQKWGAFCKTPMCDGARRVYKHHTKEGAIIAANTRAHAPSVGKDRTNEAIKVCADFAEAVVSSLKEKHQEEVAKLIESLASVRESMIEASQIVRGCKYPGPDLNDRCNEALGYLNVGMQAAWDTLSAYNGKEAAKEGGEG